MRRKEFVGYRRTNGRNGYETVLTREQVVRCRDCIRYDAAHPKYHYCTIHNTEVLESDFCSFGEENPWT